MSALCVMWALGFGIIIALSKTHTQAMNPKSADEDDRTFGFRFIESI